MFVGGSDGFFVPDGAAGLDDGGDAGSGRGVNAVPEGEESVRGHYAALDGFSGLHDADLGGVNAAHLTGADAHEFGALGVNDGVRLDVLAALPGEEEGFHFLFGGLALGDALQAVGAEDGEVSFLDEEAAYDFSGHEAGGRASGFEPSGKILYRHDADVFLLADDFKSFRGVGGGNDRLDEDLGELFSERGFDGAVEG